MSFLKKLFIKSAKEKENQQAHHNINQIYNTQPFQKKSNPIYNYNGIQRIEQFEIILEQQIIDLEQLKQLTWRGAPQVYRAKAWKLILKYIPPNHMSQTSVIQKKRQDYLQYIKNYYEQIHDRDDGEEKIIKIISNDVLRTQPDYLLFRDPKIQDLFKRLLFIWSQRHPMSGYVQGINDIAAPLIAVLLNEYVRVDFNKFDVPPEFHKLPDDILLDVEADIYWCLCKIIENIQDYFIHNQPGVSLAYEKIKNILNTIDPTILEYFHQQQIDFNHFAFRWVICLLIREFPLYLAIRIMDTYLSEGDNIANLHIYTVSNLILKCGPEIKNKNMGDAVIFLQNLPTKDWTELDIEMLLQEAYVFKEYMTNKQSLNQSMTSNQSNRNSNK
ncbi:unnamed protein product (macronuclear) [Paramecium tetraurelia]|uniref:Rab-GAP TBC domain-containing protein n=1 Tax=Paramecium tetraurelia TaxID=5888 RepID=A0DBR7_PARTE|nr:uncharacterized protein GSPATT00015381001 [Paramecium tetraurelia]CAK80484.1 unnamed protein product [Paramecium tetraurelia]|eukprot:XP_001447881.1 hypothetical protein (macronuclear) [Paramecium tetraurelia strain d4-2]